jgi:hypothetical protein
MIEHGRQVKKKVCCYSCFTKLVKTISKVVKVVIIIFIVNDSNIDEAGSTCIPIMQNAFYINAVNNS